jgi:hypothetical protein
MRTRNKKQNRAKDVAHAAEGRIDINGSNRESVEEDSGVLDGNLDSSAYQPAGSQDVSGEVSAADTASPGSSGRKRGSGVQKSSRKSKISMNLSNQFDSLALLANLDSPASDPLPEDELVEVEMPSLQSVLGQDIELDALDLGTSEGRRFILRYLTDERVSRWYRTTGSESQLEGLLQDCARDVSKTHSSSVKFPSGKVPSPERPMVEPVLPTRRRVAPENLFSKLGNSYRLGEQGLVAELAAKERQGRSHVNMKLAEDAVGLVPETPIGCITEAESELNELARTVKKVLRARPDLWTLPRRVRLRKATSMAVREIHKAELCRPRNGSVEGEKSPANSGDEMDVSSGSESLGDSCRSSRDSGSIGSYGKDSFVARSDSSSSGTDSDSEKKRGESKRVRNRQGSMNSLGTPAKPSKQSTSLVASKTFGSAPPGLMVFGDDDLKMWTIGTAKYKQGLNWEAYLHHKQAFDNHMQHKGRWSERTFKSIIHANLVPTVCASCGFSRSKWHLLEDQKLILKLEKVLRPSRSTDFAVELRAIRLFTGTGEPLMARYSVFAEKFICKCAEAEDAGKKVKPNVIKSAFKAAIAKEKVLQHWLEEVRWQGVERAHKRLLRKLREARSIEQLFAKVKPEKEGRGHGRNDERDGDDGSSEEGKSSSERRGHYKGYKGKKDSNRYSKRGRVNHTSHKPGFGKDRGPKARSEMKGDAGPKLRSWNYDRRGSSWHTEHELYGCYHQPCHKPFCQRCRRHGHTAEYCRAHDDTPGLTREGYAQENAKGKAAIQAPPSPKVNNSKATKSSQASESDGEKADMGSDRGRHCL